jgi:hypothetical protein
MSYYGVKHNEEYVRERYDLIQKLIALPQLNGYFGYLPALESPTNNTKKYPNKVLNSIYLELSYGSIESNEEIKKLYMDFVRDYQHGYEELVRIQQQ